MKVQEGAVNGVGVVFNRSVEIDSQASEPTIVERSDPFNL